MMLELRDICKTYNQGSHDVPALKNISLSVREGEYVAIMGPSGSGKTTLMNILGCLDTPTSGQYFFDGADIARISESKMSELRLNSIGFVFQSFNLMPRQTALDNVALPLLYAGVSVKERRAIATKALERVGLEDRISFKPTQLSGGQCQRVAIARAMVNSPKLLLADEPTGALDTAAGQQILDLFERLNREGVTIIMITHEQEVAARAGRVLYIRDGALVDRNGEALTNGEQFAAELPTYTAPERPAIPGRPDFSGHRKRTPDDGISARGFIAEPIDSHKTGSVDIPENYYGNGFAEEEDEGYVDIEAIAEETFGEPAPEEALAEESFEEASYEETAYEADEEYEEVFEIEDIPVFDAEPEETDEYTEEYAEEPEAYEETEEHIEPEESFEPEEYVEPEVYEEAAEEIAEEIPGDEISEPDEDLDEEESFIDTEEAEAVEEIEEPEEAEEPEERLMDDELSALLGGNAVDPADVDFPEEFLKDDEPEEPEIEEVEEEPEIEETEEEIAEEAAADEFDIEELGIEELGAGEYEEKAEETPEVYEEFEELPEAELYDEPEEFEEASEPEVEEILEVEEIEEAEELPPLFDILPDEDEPAPAQLSLDVWGYDEEEEYISIEDIPVEGFEYEEAEEYVDEYTNEYTEEYAEEYTEGYTDEYTEGYEYAEPVEGEAYADYEQEYESEVYEEIPIEELPVEEEITEETTGEIAPFSIDIDLSSAFSAKRSDEESGAEPLDPNRKGDE